MTKVCILIGEGDSERYFFPSFIENYSFVNLSQKTGSDSLYNKDNVYWFFPFPPSLSSIKKTGKTRLWDADTYQAAFIVLSNALRTIIKDYYEIVLLVPFDTDSADICSRKSQIEEAVKKSINKNHRYYICEIEVELESWYFAGIKENFPYFNNPNNNELKKLINTRTDKNKHRKEDFKRFIDYENVRGSSDIARKVARFFDQEKACRLSPSFKKFYSILEKEGLISVHPVGLEPTAHAV